MKSFYLILIFTLSSLVIYGQSKVEPTSSPSTAKSKKKILDVNPRIKQLTFDKTEIQGKTYQSRPAIQWSAADRTSSALKITRDPVNNEVIAIKGETIQLKSNASPADRSMNHLKELKSQLRLESPSEELKLLKSSTDKNGNAHHKYQQQYKGIPVLDAQITTHEIEGKVQFVNGRWTETPKKLNLVESLQATDAESVVISDLKDYEVIPDRLKRLVHGQQITTKKVIIQENNSFRLAWHVDIFETISDRWEYTIDAHTGEIINKHSTVCHFDGHTHSHEPQEAAVDGKTTSTARDLLGEVRDINIYECSGAFFLADAARTMFHGNESDCTNDDLLINGVIITWDALGTTPASPGRFQYNYSVSANKNVWDDPRAISAHYNGGRAYEYFKNTFGRESINGDRGNIESFYNVVEDDGSQMDNAFWTGAAIFYGNGNQAFRTPLSAGLDVAGHEMSHGVIQTTANLRYEGESGALNESFADVFGTMIERETWQIGEDVVNPQIFPTGALRNMADPNNGGTRLGDPGFQPASVQQQYTGAEDNGGVHINSGIPNRAYFLFADNDNVGIGRAEQIYYKVLEQYLTPRSQFIDLRTAVIEVANQDYGQVVADAAIAAFDQVGIRGNGVIKQEIPDRELESNTDATDFILWSDFDLQTINFSTNTGNFSGITFPRPHISKPSISDNGNRLVFANTDNQAQYIEIDWTTGNIVDEFILFEGIRNVVISKDGTKVAALTVDLTTGEFDNFIYIVDLISGDQQAFELYNPTFTEGISSGEVLFADAMEFDHAGENLLYDSFNSLQGNNNLDVRYWDIGIMDVWSNNRGVFSDGDNNIYKVFNGLPENVSIGNPTFSKNNPDVIAFDFREIDVLTQDTTFEVLGGNLRTGDIGTIFQNNTWGYPNYSIDDTQIIFSVEDAIGFIIGIQEINEDRITASGSATRFIRDESQWGVWFGTGTRDLISDIEDNALYNELSIYPNPASEELYLTLPDELSGEVLIEMYSIDGTLQQKVREKGVKNQLKLNISSLEGGTFILKLTTDDKLYSQKFMVID